MNIEVSKESSTTSAKMELKGAFVDLPTVSGPYVATPTVDRRPLLVSMASSQEYELHVGQHRASKVKSKCFTSEFQMGASPSLGQVTLESFMKDDSGKHNLQSEPSTIYFAVALEEILIYL